MSEAPNNEPFEALLCSACFEDHGLSLDAHSLGMKTDAPCPHCSSPTGRKLDCDSLLALADTFFVRGTLVRAEYGAAPVLQFNEYHHRKTEIEVNERLLRDANRLGEAAGVGFFHYGPHLWMLGEVEPLKALHDASTRDHVVKRILKEFPERTLSPSQRILRLRRNPNPPTEPSEYDTPLVGQRGNGRLDAEDFPVLYASQDVEVCVHECRVTVEDDLYMATLAPLRDLRLLDLTAVLEEDVTEFDSLDMAVHLLSHAAPHSYTACRAVATAASRAGFLDHRHRPSIATRRSASPSHAAKSARPTTVNTTPPGTHIKRPAICWSSSAVKPHVSVNRRLSTVNLSRTRRETKALMMTRPHHMFL